MKAPHHHVSAPKASHANTDYTPSSTPALDCLYGKVGRGTPHSQLPTRRGMANSSHRAIREWSFAYQGSIYSVRYNHAGHILQPGGTGQAACGGVLGDAQYGFRRKSFYFHTSFFWGALSRRIGNPRSQ